MPIVSSIPTLGATSNRQQLPDVSPYRDYVGPTFQRVEELAWEDFQKKPIPFGPQSGPVLIKGAVKTWPAWEKWSFDSLADLRKPDGSETIFRFQNGLVEQGVTRPPLDLPVSPYLRELAEKAKTPSNPETGLMPLNRLKRIWGGETFHLDWNYMKTFQANKVYLAQWHILDEFPELRNDFAIRQMWPGWRWTWEYVFMGPSHTVTGLHFDFPNNWFCQVRGVKEVLLFPPDQSEHLCPSKKYDWGATLSDVNISRLDEQPKEREAFGKAKGLYARVEAGDALFIPKRTWHTVVALEPSISLAVFGLRPYEIIVRGGQATFWQLLHQMGLYRNGNCTCHRMDGVKGHG